ncbi:MAG: diguanylate cyclase [Clostridiales bacterium]|nr:diguanylate cyclase [Clostridiales bacterium]
MESFGYVSVIALFSYTFLMLIFLAAKKNRLINRFLFLMFLMICWTGGSMLMRFQMWPSYKFWYHVSVDGLLLLPYAYLLFINEMAERKMNSLEKIMVALLVITVAVNSFTNCFLRYPDIISGENGDRFVYSMTGSVLWLFLLCGIAIIYIFAVIVIESRRNRRLAKRFEPVILGLIVIFIGQALLSVPVFSGFPIDVFSGIINVIFLFYALVKRRLFQLKMLANERVCYGVGILLSLVLFYNLSPFLAGKSVFGAKYSPMFFVVCFALLLILITFIWQLIVQNVFVKEEMQQAENLREYSNNVSKSLNLEEILDQTVKVIRNMTEICDVYICLLDEKNGVYRTVYSNQPLSDLSFSMRTDHPLVSYLRDENDSLMMREFRHSWEYKSMWESEKQKLADLHIECCSGFRSEDELVGMILLSSKGKKGHITLNDQRMIDSIRSIASIAIKNAKLYKKAYEEARTDELTGLLNRKYFYEVLEEEYERSKEGSLALLILNVDDFKLYNQLYGASEADLALRNIAQIVTATVGSNGIVARYSGKEFAILLPGYDVFSAENLAEGIRKQIYEMNQDSSEYKMKMLTVSVGISVAPFGASSAAELVNNADMAVYHVKRNGKNAIRVFDVQIQDDHKTSPMNVQAYQEYETTIYALTAAIDAKDHYTFNHSINVAKYATQLAALYGCNSDMVEIARQAGLMHDVGKIGIPEEILNKPGKLTEEEYRVIQGHVEASISIIRHLPSMDYVVPAVIGHHERYDGKGYPRRIQGENIPILARILCVVDSFDAMVSKRSYKSSMPVEKALGIIEEEAGRQFDPAIAALFVKSVREGEIIPFSGDTDDIKNK